MVAGHAVRPVVYLVDMEHPKSIGDRTTLAAMIAIQSHGYAISVPFGENVRYDLVIDDGECLARVQCKTGRLRAGAVLFNTCSTYGHHRDPANARRDYYGDVDYFAVYCPQTCGVYLVPIGDLVATNQASLRIDPPRNRQQRFIRPAANYQIATVG
jgi:hypothetical protein